MQLNEDRNATHITFVRVVWGDLPFASVNMWSKADFSTGFIICSITVSCKQHSGQFNLKFQFEISFLYKCWRGQWSNVKWKITILLFEQSIPFPAIPPSCPTSGKHATMTLLFHKERSKVTDTENIS